MIHTYSITDVCITIHIGKLLKFMLHYMVQVAIHVSTEKNIISILFAWHPSLAYT